VRIEGAIRANLLAAIGSAKRLRGQPVHEDTLAHWRGIAEHARLSGSEADLLGELEAEIAGRR
jgi:hypothetical protein